MSFNNTETASFDWGRREMNQDQKYSEAGQEGWDVGDMQKWRVN